MEDRLEQALGGWASASRVGSREADRIRTAILLTPKVDALWWDQFNQQMARLTRGASRPQASEPAARGWAERPRVGWGVAG